MQRNWQVTPVSMIILLCCVAQAHANALAAIDIGSRSADRVLVTRRAGSKLVDRVSSPVASRFSSSKLVNRALKGARHVVLDDSTLGKTQRTKLLTLGSSAAVVPLAAVVAVAKLRRKGRTPPMDGTAARISNHIGTLLNVTANPEAQAKAAGALRELLKQDEIENDQKISKAGGIQALIQVLRNGSQAAHLQEEAAGALGYLANNGVHQDVIREGGGIKELIKVLRSKGCGSVAQEEISGALRVVTRLAPSRDEVAKQGGIQGLIGVLRDGNNESQGYAAVALGNMAPDLAFSNIIRAAGGIHALIHVLRNGTEQTQIRAASALGNLALKLENREGKWMVNSSDPINLDNHIVIRQEGGITAVLDLFKKGSAEAKSKAAGAVTNLALSRETQNVMIAHGAMELFVEVLRDTASNLAVSEMIALALLRIIHESDSNSAAFVALQGIEALINLLGEGTENGLERAAMALLDLANPRGPHKNAVIDAMMEALKAGDDLLKQRVVSWLNTAAASSMDLRESIQKALDSDTALTTMKMPQ